MKLRDGGTYRRRDGAEETVRLRENHDGLDYPFASHDHVWTSEGRYWMDGQVDDDWDLVEELKPPPAEKTRIPSDGVYMAKFRPPLGPPEPLRQEVAPAHTLGGDTAYWPVTTPPEPDDLFSVLVVGAFVGEGKA